MEILHRGPAFGRRLPQAVRRHESKALPNEGPSSAPPPNENVLMAEPIPVPIACLNCGEPLPANGTPICARCALRDAWLHGHEADAVGATPLVLDDLPRPVSSQATTSRAPKRHQRASPS